jgi:hypothetical protein
MESKDIAITIDETNKLHNIKHMLKDIIIKEFTDFVKDKVFCYKYDYNKSYNIINTYNNAYKYLINRNFSDAKMEELDSLLEILSKSDYEYLFFSQYDNINAISVLQEVILYYLTSVYCHDAYNDVTIDNNIYSLILTIFQKNNIITMLPTEEMNWVHQAERLLEAQVIDSSTIELSPIEILEEMNKLIDKEPLLLADLRYSSYAICIGVLSYIKEKLSN